MNANKFDIESKQSNIFVILRALVLIIGVMAIPVVLWNFTIFSNLEKISWTVIAISSLYLIKLSSPNAKVASPAASFIFPIIGVASYVFILYERIRLGENLSTLITITIFLISHSSVLAFIIQFFRTNSRIDREDR